MTFTVTTGTLSMTAPDTANLGTARRAPPSPARWDAVTVTDDRALLAAAWTATASASDWTTGGATPAETIPATDVGYDPGSITTTGTITATGRPPSPWRSILRRSRS